MAKTYTPAQHKTAQQFMKVQGILAIVFGGLGVLFTPLLIVFLSAIINNYSLLGELELTQDDVISFILRLILVFPASIFLVISGILLVRNPAPKLAKGLTIANVVVAAFTNLVVLAFAIVSLVQMEMYKAAHHTQK